MEMDKQEILDMYSQPWRYHHSKKHINQMRDAWYAGKYSRTFDETVFVNARLFHDCVYEPVPNADNEQKSNELWLKWVEYCREHDVFYPKDTVKKVSELILSTADPFKKTTDPFVILFRNLDWNFMGETHDITPEYAQWLTQYEDDIFREYQKADIVSYVSGRLDFIDKAESHGLMTKEVAAFLRPLVTRKRRIAYYAGTFKPFHTGHLNILRKAEKLFDKVVVWLGHNEKKQGQVILPEFDNVDRVLRHHQVIRSEDPHAQLVDFLNKERNQYCEPVLVRGLRSGYDLEDERKRLFYMNGQCDVRKIPHVALTYIYCDKEYDHVASSDIKMFKNEIDRAMYMPEPQ